MKYIQIEVSDVEIMDIMDDASNRYKSKCADMERRLCEAEKRTGRSRMEFGAGINHSIVSQMCNKDAERHAIESKLKEKGWNGSDKFERIDRFQNIGKQTTTIRFHYRE